MKKSSLMSVAVLAGIFGSAGTGWGGSGEISAQTDGTRTELRFGVSLTTDKAIYAAGESIVMELIVFNRTAEDLIFDFRDGQHFDFMIEDAAGTRVWRWAEGRMFIQVLGEEILGPGREEVAYTDTYIGPLQPGDYRIIGAFVSTNRPLSASVTITVE